MKSRKTNEPSSQPIRSDDSAPVGRRLALIAHAQAGPDALPALRAALEDGDVLIRRTAFRWLAEMGAPALDAIRAAFRHGSADIRRLALFSLGTHAAADPEILRQALADEEEAVRAQAVELLAQTRPRTPAIDALLKAASTDPSNAVRRGALQGVLGEVQSRSVRSEHMDRVIEVRHVLALPEEGWKWSADEDGLGHTHDWFDPAHDDRGWADIRIAMPWPGRHIGVGWYRRTIDMPRRVPCAGVELHFEGVCESAWLWYNGRYAGAHDIGAQGRTAPFSMDITDLVRWGEPNHVSVRVMNTDLPGGIEKPVFFHFLHLP